MKHYDYCPYCRKRTEHIKEGNEMLCKRCGRIEPRINPLHLIINNYKERR
jgi:NADH pyrophosphatase NudC (nudix superfamily)